MFRFGLWLKMRSTVMSMVSWSVVLLKRLIKSKETRNLLKRFAFLIWETKKNVCRNNQQIPTKGERRSQRKQARL